MTQPKNPQGFSKPDLKFYDHMSEALWDLAGSSSRYEALKHINMMAGLLSDYIPGMESHKLQLAIVREENAPHRARKASSPGMDDEDDEQGAGSVPEGAT